MSSPKYGARNPFLAETLSRYSDAFSENPRGTVTFRRVFVSFNPPSAPLLAARKLPLIMRVFSEIVTHVS